MLVALMNNDENQRVYADEANKEDESGNKINYFCPDCGSPLILRQGTKNRYHFAHENSDDKSCVFLRLHGGESITHDSMKRYIKEIIEKYNICIVSELEYRVGNRIADYYCEIVDYYGNRKKIAVECVHHNTNIDEFRAKNEDYVSMGVNVLWLFNAERFIAGYSFDETKPTSKHTLWKQEFRRNEILKECHTMYYGKVYALNLNDNTMWGIHFNSVTRTRDGYIKTDWESFLEDREIDGYADIEDYQYVVGGNEYYLKETKSPSARFIAQFKLTSFKTQYADEYLSFNRMIAQPFIRSWWKKASAY